MKRRSREPATTLQCTHRRTTLHPSQNFLTLLLTFIPRIWPTALSACGAAIGGAIGRARGRRVATAAMRGMARACVLHWREEPARRRTKPNMVVVVLVF